MLEPFTCEDANKLRWSNDFLDSVLAMRLLLNTYQTRPEAAIFWSQKKNSEELCLPRVQIIPELDAKIRSTLDLKAMGTTREATNDILSTFQLLLGVFRLPISVISFFKEPRAILTNALDPYIKDATYSRLEFILRYKNEFLKKSLGGTWKPHFTIQTFSPILIKKVIICTNILIHYPIVPILEYQRALTALCYNSGLECWWAPDLLLAQDKTQWFKPIPKEEYSQPSLDGLLGAVFPRILNDTLHTSDKGTPWSDDFFNEWLLFEMSGKETTRDFGTNHGKTIEEIRKSWGYKPNREWKQRNFDMLFDRIFLKHSLEEIAHKYPWEDVAGKTDIDKKTVQRITSELANLLMLPLPRAAYKKHSRN